MYTDDLLTYLVLSKDDHNTRTLLDIRVCVLYVVRFTATAKRCPWRAMVSVVQARCTFAFEQVHPVASGLVGPTQNRGEG
jgi:hypothetical protein